MDIPNDEIEATIQIIAQLSQVQEDDGRTDGGTDGRTVGGTIESSFALPGTSGTQIHFPDQDEFVELKSIVNNLVLGDRNEDMLAHIGARGLPETAEDTEPQDNKIVLSDFNGEIIEIDSNNVKIDGMAINLNEIIEDAKTGDWLSDEDDRTFQDLSNHDINGDTNVNAFDLINDQYNEEIKNGHYFENEQNKNEEAMFFPTISFEQSTMEINDISEQSDMVNNSRMELAAVVGETFNNKVSGPLTLDQITTNNEIPICEENMACLTLEEPTKNKLEDIPIVPISKPVLDRPRRIRKRPNRYAPIHEPKREEDILSLIANIKSRPISTKQIRKSTKSSKKTKRSKTRRKKKARSKIQKKKTKVPTCKTTKTETAPGEEYIFTSNVQPVASSSFPIPSTYDTSEIIPPTPGISTLDESINPCVLIETNANTVIQFASSSTVQNMNMLTSLVATSTAQISSESNNMGSSSTSSNQVTQNEAMESVSAVTSIQTSSDINKFSDINFVYDESIVTSDVSQCVKTSDDMNEPIAKEPIVIQSDVQSVSPIPKSLSITSSPSEPVLISTVVQSEPSKPDTKQSKPIEYEPIPGPSGIHLSGVHRSSHQKPNARKSQRLMEKQSAETIQDRFNPERRVTRGALKKYGDDIDDDLPLSILAKKWKGSVK